MSNTAAVTNGSDSAPYFEIKSIAIPEVPKDKILVKSVAFAINPTDWKHLVSGRTAKGAIVGSDVSGIVEKVGSEVSGFAEGDYVGTFVHGAYEEGIGAFQQYAVINPVQAIKYSKSEIDTEKVVPVGDSPLGKIDTFEGAASITLSLSTVAMSFSNQLKLKVENKSEYNDKFILIWGGASSAGILAIQIAKLVYGLKVITTASKKNNDFLTSLGADTVIDYKDSDAIAQIRKVGAGKIYYALDTISSKETYQSVYDSTSETEGPVVIDNLLALRPSDIKTDPARSNVKFVGTLVYLVTGEPVKMGQFVIQPPKDLVEDYNNFWFNILPGVLPKIKHPALKVLQAGLESATEGLSLLQNNKVSAQKVVFRI